jgi:hypothetical protein
MAKDKHGPQSEGSGKNTGDDKGQDRPQQGNKIQGEGDYEAARRYDDKTRQFVRSHDVEQEARDAAPENAGEQRAMEQAEQEGKARAKEEDPLLDDPEQLDRGGEAPTGGGKKSTRR